MNRPIHGGNLAWAATIAGCPASLLLDFSASINPLGPPQSAIAAIQGGLSALSAYPDPAYSSLCSALAEFHELPPEWILPGNGAAELLTWASWELSQQSLTYLITPAFGDYWRGLNTFKAKVQRCSLLPPGEDNFLTSLPELFAASIPKEQQQNLKSAGLLLNNPHNPTGKLFSVAEILPYLEQFGLVVVDEAFMDFLLPEAQESLIASVQDYPNLVILRSLTKFYSLPGLRLGYAIAHPNRLQQWQQWRDPWPVNILAAMAGEAVIQDTAFQQQTWDWLSAAKSSLFQGIASLEGLHPLESAANFLLVRSEISSLQLQERLLKRYRILIRDCLSFPELGDRYFRIAVRTETNNQRLLEGLSSIL